MRLARISPAKAATATAIAAILVSNAAGAGDRQSLTPECEVAIALSALPKRLREDTTVYALVDGEYEVAVKGDGPFTCVVERNDKDALIPQCMDEAGVDSVLPAILDRSRMSVAGVEFAELREKSDEKIHSGHFPKPSRPGISYMMSDYNYIYAGNAGRVLKIPPHVMFYAPDLKNTDVGGSLESVAGNHGTPFIVDEGPHGYMVVYTEHAADANDAAMACEGQLGEVPPRFTPFPQG